MEEFKIAKKRKPFTPTTKIAVGYLLLIALGAIILLLPFATWENKSIGITTALFTSTSAVCVTGLTVVDTFTTFSWFGQGVIFVLIQMGGLGFMTMAALMLLLLGKKLSLKDKLSIAESFSSDDMSTVTKFVKTIAITTFVIDLSFGASNIKSSITFSSTERNPLAPVFILCKYAVGFIPDIFMSNGVERRQIFIRVFTLKN